ncbi:MAG TPA: adenylate/guanylate cyclase domain-containing protein [Rhodospirillales bacterium]|nr:adenylate/guanylate cyclase domain-containing protein [Rhodospirillales bacterium]
MPRWIKGLLVGIVTGLCGALLSLSAVGYDLEKFFGLKHLFTVRGAITPPDDVALVAIYPDAARRLGLPLLPRDWSREIHARLIDRLVEAGASAIVFDLDLERPKSFAEDGTFANAIRAADRVVLYERLDGRRVPIIGATGAQTGWQWVEQVGEPTDALAEAAKAIGSFPLPKLDVAVYDFWTFKTSGGDAPTVVGLALQIHATKIHSEWRDLLRSAGLGEQAALLPAAPEDLGPHPALRDAMNAIRREVERRGAPVLSTALGAGAGGTDRPVLDALVRLYEGPANRYLNFYGPPGTIQRLSYDAVINAGSGGAGAIDLRDKVVFVGYSDLYDPGQPDRFYSVFTRSDGVDLSGVEIMATAFANLLTDRTLRTTGTWQTVAITALFGLAVGAGIFLLPALIGVPLALALGAGYAVSAQLAFNRADLWLPLVVPLLLQLPVALFVGLLGQYLFERRQKTRATEAISYYLPDSAVKALTAGGREAEAINKVVYATCFATDMAGFSTLAERMAPKELAAFLNDYFDTIAAPLKLHGVDVTEFRADAIMCAWTSPEPTVEVRRRAVLAALDTVEAVESFNSRHEPIRLAPRVGLEAGSIYIGHAGGGGRFVYSIVGDCANAASRIESLNKRLNTSLLASDTVTVGLDGLLLRPLGRFVFVGKSQPTAINEIVARATAASPAQRRLCDRYAEALALFDRHDWAGAAARADALLTEFPEDGPGLFLLAKCRQYLNLRPGEDDPAIIRLDSK